jgi:hypothetical protein
MLGLPPGRLSECILDLLTPFGASLDDVQVKQAPSSPTAGELTCPLPGVGGLVRYSLRRVELLSEARNEDQWASATTAAVEVVTQLAPKAERKEHAFAIAHHFRTAKGDPPTELGRYVANLPHGDLDLSLQGLVFTYPIQGVSTGQGTVNFERSLLRDDAMFLRVIDFRPGSLGVGDAYHRSQKTVRMVLELFGYSLALSETTND